MQKIVVSSVGSAFGAAVKLNEDFFSRSCFKFYYLCEDGPLAESVGDAEDGSNEDGVVGCHQWELPNLEFEGLWDSLIFESDIKDKVGCTLLL